MKKTMIWKISKLTLAGTIIVSLSPSYALGGFFNNIVDDVIPDIQIPGSGPIGDISFDPLDLLQNPEGTLSGLAESIFGDLIGGLLTEVFSGNCDTDPEGGTTNPDMNWMCEAMEPVEVINTDAENFVAGTNAYYDTSAVDWIASQIDFATQGVLGEEAQSKQIQELFDLLQKAGGTEDESRAAADQFMAKSSQIVQESINARIDALLESGNKENPDINDVINQATVINYTALADEGKRLQTLLRTSNYNAQSALNVQRSSEIISRIQEDESLIKSVENTAIQAQELIDRENAAVSTRAAVQYMGEGIAALMVQQAMQNAQIVESVRTNSIQQAYTTNQLGLLVQQLANDSVQESQKDIAEYNKKVESQKNSIDSSFDMVEASADLLESITKPKEIKW